MIIAVVGMAGAGKSESCTFFKEKGFSVLRFGDQTDIGLKELGLERNEDNERKYRENLRKELGMSAYAIKIIPRIEALKKKKNNHKIVLDGLYSWEEYVILKKKYPELLLLCIYCRPKIRYERLLLRKVRPLNSKKARERDIAEIVNSHKGGPIAFCDYLAVNEGSVKDLYKELNIFLLNYRHEYNTI